MFVFKKKKASEIILLFNNWFDLLNTQHKFDKGVKSYGLDETNQNDLLEKMNSFIKSMRVHKKKSLLPFQKGKIVMNNLYIFKLYPMILVHKNR